MKTVSKYLKLLTENYRSSFFIWLFLILNFSSFSQTFPVQVSTQLMPPYSGYLPDYADPSSEKLKIILQFNDFTVSQYNLRLRIEIKGNGFVLSTKTFYNPPPITLEPGVPLQLSGPDLAPYLNSANLDFTGINLSQYEQRMALPEGYYSICVKAYDYYNPNNIQVSNESCTQAWFTYSDPPFLNLPLCNKVVTPQNPQNIIFQWTPLNQGSPNSAANTEYEFGLWELRPDSNANPNQIVLSTAPVYSTVTNLTFLNYGITETPLNLYMKYVWRVRAKDITGRDWFKNNGYSQICTFTYGNPLNVLGDALKLNLTAQGVTHRLGICSWNTQSLFTQYNLQVRKLGTNNWFDYNVTQGSEKITNLEPDNTYEARVRGQGNGMTGEWSNTTTFKTLPEPVYSCNDQTQYNEALQAQPLPVAKALPGLIIQSGQFEVSVTEILPNGPPGWYRGKGYAGVMNNMRVAVKFDNIYIDDNARHQQGVIEALTNGVNKWLAQWDVNDARENAIYTNDHIDSVYIYNGKICFTTDKGIECFDFPDDQNVVVVRDEDGREWVITPPDKITGPTNYFKISGDSLAASDNLKAVFEASEKQLFGFDKKEQAAWADQYEIIKLRDGKYYFVPNKSIGKDKSDEVLVSITADNFNASLLNFRDKDENILTASNMGDKKFKITGISADAGSIYAWYDGKKIGKLNVVSLEGLSKKLVLVPVNNASPSLGEGTMGDALNTIYKQANVNWTVKVRSGFNYDLGTNGLDAADATLLSKYSTEMRALRDAYRNFDSTYDKEAYYVFVVKNFSDPSQNGYMVRGRAVGFISQSATAKEIAHELGHGAFGLEHTFPKVKQSSSTNLLDYGTGVMLTKKQWEEMRGSLPIFNWLDGEEDAAFSSSDFEKWLKERIGLQCYETYKNYDGIIPQCIWNNNLYFTKTEAYGNAFICGIVDGAFILIRDAYNIGDFLSCNSLSSPFYFSKNCSDVREKTEKTLITVKELCGEQGALQKVCSMIGKELGDWSDATFCTDVTCAYNQGKLTFDIVSLFFGVGEVKAALKSGVAGADIANLVAKVDKTAVVISNAIKKSILTVKKTVIGFSLALRLSAGEFVFGSLEAATKAIRFNVAPLAAGMLPNNKVLAKLDNITYVVKENGQDVVKRETIEIVEEKGTALPRLVKESSAGGFNINPKNIREAAKEWLGVKRTNFDLADQFYNEVGYSNFDNHLRGIDFNHPVKKTTFGKGEFVYQYCKLDPVSGKPKIGSYFYKNKEVDVKKLGFDLEDRVMVRMKLEENGTFLESTASDIEDWAGSTKIFKGGETQLFNPKAKVTEVSIIN